MGEKTYLKLGFVLCVFITSAESRRNTHTLCYVSGIAKDRIMV